MQAAKELKLCVYFKNYFHLTEKSLSLKVEQEEEDGRELQKDGKVEALSSDVRQLGRTCVHLVSSPFFSYFSIPSLSLC